MSQKNLTFHELEEVIPLALGIEEETVVEMINENYSLEDYLINKFLDHHESHSDLVWDIVSGLMEMIFVAEEGKGKVLKGFGIDKGDFILAAANMKAK